MAFMQALSRLGGAAGKAATLNPIGLVGAGLDIVNSIGDLVPNAYEQRNNARVKELTAMEKGGALGLSGVQKQNLGNTLMMQPRVTGAQQANVYSAGQQGAAPGELARVRRDQGSVLAGAGQQAAAGVYSADKAEEGANKQELEQRLAMKAGAAEDDRSAIMKRAGNALDVAGQTAGEVPLGIMGPNGTPLKDWGEAERMMASIGINPDQVAAIRKLGPEYVTRLFERHTKDVGNAPTGSTPAP